MTNVPAVNQTKAQAGHSNVGGNQYNDCNLTVQRRKTQIEIWMEKLADEVRENQQAQQMVDSLQYYHKKHSVDGIDGLEAKLDHAQMGSRKLDAIRKKEFFGKLLEEKSFYASAQEIFAYLLSCVEVSFNTYVFPNVGTLSADQIDILVKEKVADPLLSEVSSTAFMLNYNHVLGMVYWLAEQCFVRWHK